ncbi:uncharacterized protein EI97DRAFT_379225 [Westerdykella ornata]|uniref:Nucleotide-diphospho-sugar transferase domain-containing protein n=1 Tax=Westerdykella ornata TaxID=318751 RepID=A0A6A6JFB0_WESOR|nr:uncharacterized protein EI97DRAFT_379225 [Westerdykella ornata]KAF2275310.1 hypothetical protein EI97DRAFT_379225 [Westerdykella ornata]
MLPALGSRFPLLLASIFGGTVVLSVFVFVAWHSGPRPAFPRVSSSAFSNVGHSKSPQSFAAAVSYLFSELKTPVDEPAIDDGTGKKKALRLPNEPRFREPLGKKILILDLDTRPLESTEDYNKGTFDWRTLEHVPAGVFEHYVYAQVHGYDYKFIQAPNFQDRHATWIKPSALANEINNYKFIVFLDADAAFRWLHVPIEWMLNYWKIQPEHSLTMALDPWDEKEPQCNSDRFNRTYTNTGFIVAQNNEHTMQILKDWHECPDDTKYPGCSQWKKPRFHEQSAFGEYVRYDYEQYIKELPCAEANGFPGVEVSHCQGQFIRHYWFDKWRVKEDFRENIMQAFTMKIQQIFAEDNGTVIHKTGKNVIHA